MLMTLEDYKKFVSIEDMSELAEHMLLLGRTLAQGEGFAEHYRAANVTVLQSSVVMMWSLDASCKDITAIFRSFILIRRQVRRSALQK